MTRQPKVYVVDDQASVRNALGEMLNVFGFQVETFASADEFLARMTKPQPGCVIADVRMPGRDGIELVRDIVRRELPLLVVLISGHADVPMAVAGIKAGAQDFIEKPVDDAELVAAINRCLMRVMQRPAPADATSPVAERFKRLTPRQVEVFDLVAEGFTSVAIAAKLQISQRTVESYRAEVMEKMQAESVAVLVRQAIRLGRVTP
jgi:two-component system response regulator FixJ